MKQVLTLIASCFLAALPLSAQFYSAGNEPPMKWSQIKTPGFRLVYPAGLDSLAREYAYSLEKYRQVVGNSCYTAPNELYKKPMPVVLHPFNAYANGSVAWAPRTMNLFTTPEAYGMEAWPWMDQLTLHESRHVSQLQFGKFPGLFRFFSAITGQLTTGTLSAVFPGPALLEGDAVAAETALSQYGRGRSSEFLNYMKVSFDAGEYRNYWKWRWSSQKRYTPDHYKVGYMLVGGMRATYNEPDFTGIYYERLDKWALRTLNLQKTVKKVSGKKFRHAFREIEEHFHEEWKAADSLRAQKAPFMEGEPVTRPDRLFDSYNDIFFLNNGELVADRAGLQRNNELVGVKPGEKSVHREYFPSMTSNIVTHPIDGSLWWTEYLPSPSWDLKSWSVLKKRGEDGKTVTVAKRRRLYNVGINDAGDRIATADYHADGRYFLDVFSSKGELLDSLEAPAGMQVVEPVYVGDRLYTTAVTKDGYGIYSTWDWSAVAGPLFGRIARPSSKDGRIWFLSEVSGQLELWSADPESGELLRHTSTRYGIESYAFSPDGSEFYYTTLSTDSRGIYKLPTTSLTALKDDFLPTPVKIAEKLSAGEREQAKDGVFSISEPEHYNRMEHAIRIHSWAPVYVDYDPVEDLSFETKQFASSFGATAMFQNDLSTVTGNVGVSLISMYDDILDYYREGYDGEIPGDPGHIDSAVFKPSIHAQVAFSGLPVRVLFRADIGERNAYRDRYQTNEGAIYCIREAGSKPLVKLTSQFYVPFDLSRRGWQRGLIPSYKFTYTNDEMADMRYSWGSASPGYRSGCFRGIASLRFYNMLPVTSSGIFPRWGIGLEAGNVKTNNEQLHLYPSGKFSCDNQNYAMAYAYLPGFMRTHGFSIQGYISKSYGSKIVERTRSYVNAEYAMPFAPVDWSFLGPVAYIRNFEFRAHYYAAWDNVVLLIDNNSRQNDLTQRVGISLLARLGNFFWLPFDTRVGVRLMKGIGGSSSYSEFVFTTDL